MNLNQTLRNYMNETRKNRPWTEECVPMQTQEPAANLYGSRLTEDTVLVNTGGPKTQTITPEGFTKEGMLTAEQLLNRLKTHRTQSYGEIPNEGVSNQAEEPAANLYGSSKFTVRDWNNFLRTAQNPHSEHVPSAVQLICIALRGEHSANEAMSFKTRFCDALTAISKEELEIARTWCLQYARLSIDNWAVRAARLIRLELEFREKTNWDPSQSNIV